MGRAGQKTPLCSMVERRMVANRRESRSAETPRNVASIFCCILMPTENIYLEKVPWCLASSKLTTSHHHMEKRSWTIMTEMDHTNAVDGAGEPTNPLGRLEEAQIICVIGNSPLPLSSSLFATRCLRMTSRRTRRRQGHAVHKTGR